MTPPARILFVFAASLTEARSMLLAFKEVEKDPRVSLKCLMAAHIANDARLSLTQKILQKQNISYRTAGFDAPLSAKRILAQYEPDVIVLGNDCAIINRFIVLEAAAQGVPTVLIQEGLMNYIPIVLSKRSRSWLLTHISTAFFLTRAYFSNGAFDEWVKALVKTILCKPIGNRAYGFNKVSLFCVLSEFDAENFRKNGSAARRILPTGIPGLTDVGRGSIYQPSTMRDYDFVLFTTCEDQQFMTPEAQLAVYQDIVTAIRTVKPGARIGIKFHQLENTRKFCALTGIEVITTLDEAFARGRVMVGTTTTVLLQALLTGFPVVSYLPEEHRYQWAESFLTDACFKLGIQATNKTSLTAILARSLNGLEKEPHLVSFREFWKERLQNSAVAIKNEIIRIHNDHSLPA
ncbi:MAG: hypothetical protein IMZ61_15070 [Planctomycetes bacterium]|nr:hypothetical protein [Planctomycetota bacterium]